MPFTFSHPAIVLPLKYFPKKWFSLTGLVIGSMVPDFEYFIRMKVKSIYSHTIDGIFWFDLPLALLLAFLFHNIVKKYLFQNLPKSFQIRLSIFNDFNWNNYFKNNCYYNYFNFNRNCIASFLGQLYSRSWIFCQSYFLAAKNFFLF